MRRGLFYGWVMVAVAFGVILLGAGTRALAYLTAGWMAVAAGVVILALRRTRATPAGGLATA